MRLNTVFDDHTHAAVTRSSTLNLRKIPSPVSESRTLQIVDVDIVDGTPLLDIKPYVPEMDGRNADRIGWLAGKVDKMHTARSGDFG